MPDFTPGPWAQDEYPSPRGWIVTSDEPSNGDSRGVAWVSAGRTEWRANARLIAAAPDLYDALLSLRGASSPKARALARRWADDALAKAAGGSAA